jgi:hypothetical protein
MTIKLLAHILRSSPLADGPAAPTAARPLDFRRWVLEELVARRWEPIGWRQQLPRAQLPAPAQPEATPGAPSWSDTQPWYHE